MCTLWYIILHQSALLTSEGLIKWKKMFMNNCTELLSNSSMKTSYMYRKNYTYIPTGTWPPAGVLALEGTGISKCLFHIYNVQPQFPPWHSHGQHLVPVVQNVLLEQYLHLDQANVVNKGTRHGYLNTATFVNITYLMIKHVKHLPHHPVHYAWNAPWSVCNLPVLSAIIIMWYKMALK